MLAARSLVARLMDIENSVPRVRSGTWVRGPVHRAAATANRPRRSGRRGKARLKSTTKILPLQTLHLLLGQGNLRLRLLRLAGFLWQFYFCIEARATNSVELWLILLRRASLLSRSPIFTWGQRERASAGIVNSNPAAIRSRRSAIDTLSLLIVLGVVVLPLSQKANCGALHRVHLKAPRSPSGHGCHSERSVSRRRPPTTWACAPGRPR